MDFQVPDAPKTTFNVGRIGGGTSINSIASEVWLEMDMRSPSMESLKGLDARFLDAVNQALKEEIARWSGRAGSLPSMSGR